MTMLTPSPNILRIWKTPVRFAN
uniref:Uncharacterized protein n=1 Tax=Rhizophora mucronata TaxID=61149 RepID=A0A2P2PI23_RHIMU